MVNIDEPRGLRTWRSDALERCARAQARMYGAESRKLDGMWFEFARWLVAARREICAALAVLVFIVPTPLGAQQLYGLAMHGAPALPPDFPHLPYVNPDAPKGGRLTLGLIGSFDSLNPFIVRGQAVGAMHTYVYEALMMRSLDEPFTLYGLIAKSVEVPDDRSSITFHLDPRAHFSDGVPITADDVVFSLGLLRDKGWPNLRAYYSKVETAERLDAHTVRLAFPHAQDRELPLILGLMPVLPKHKIDPETFDQTTLEPLVGSGPYRVKTIEPGKTLVLERDPNWWAKDLPIVHGYYNFDELRYEFYRDAVAMFEAFKRGLIDLRNEDDPTLWATGYDFPAVREGRVIKDAFVTGLPKPMFGVVLNTRRPLLADRRVREALLDLFDFEWIDANLFSGAYRRTASFFEGSELASVGRPADAGEAKLLTPFPDAVTPEVMAGTWRPPTSDGSGFDRRLIRRALDLLKEVGFTPRDGKLVDQTGKPLSFEVMINLREHERLMLAWKRTFERLGIDFSIRLIDAAQFERRRQTYDYDMMLWAWSASLSPGNEQAYRWGSVAADQPGSLNLSGVHSPAVDATIEALIAAKTREELVTAARALDRMLISGLYVLPLYHLPEQRIAHWVNIRHPDRTALFGPAVDTWWRASE